LEENKSKPKGAKLGASARNLLASFPWLKNKTFLIPALASVLAISVVGAVLALQATNSPSAQESVDVSQDESMAEVIAEPVIGPACAEGEPVCEHVKYLLLEANYLDGVNPWGYEELIDSIVYLFDVTSEFARAVVDAVEYDWGNDVTASGDSGSGSSTGTSSSQPSAQSPINTESPPVATTKGSALEDARFHVDNFHFSRAELIDTLVQNFGHSRSDVIAAIDSLNVNWNLEAKQSAESIAKQGPFSPERIRGALRFLKFLDAEAEAGVAALGIDEYAQADLMARDFLRRQTPPCNFTYYQALDYMTEREYFEEDPASFALLGYLELDENNEDVWLLCGR